MAKLIKGGNVQNIIMDSDVIMTSESKLGKTLDVVLEEQQSDIDRLKSNVKYIYAYGGVGGSGTGGGSGSSSNSNPILLVLLNGVEVKKDGDVIILDGAGKYSLYVKINNAGEKNYFMGYTTNGSVVSEDKINIPIDSSSKYKKEIDIDLTTNGILNVSISDSEGNIIGYYRQQYIIESDAFSVSLNYIDIEGNEQQYAKEPYECFVTDPNRLNRFFKINYSIYLPNYTDVNVECSIDGVGNIYSGNERNIEIPLDSIKIGDEDILQNKYMGTYTLNATLKYIITGVEVVRKRSFLFSIVPSGLYINVRTNNDVLYETLDILENDIANGTYKSINQGSSLMMYSKVFEGMIGSNLFSYDVSYKAFDMDVDENGSPNLGDNGEYMWNQLGISVSETLDEQIESYRGVAVTFPTSGIKKIEVTTTSKKSDVNTEMTYTKFVYVKPFVAKCDWYDNTRNSIIMDSYFKANQGENTYNYFPSLSSGEDIFSMEISSNPIELQRDSWNSNTDKNICTVITLGIQVSNINSENAKILDIYTTTSGTKSEYTLRTERLFTDADDEKNKIAIPTEVLNKNESSQYHLVQIIRNLSGVSDGQPVFEDSLYIDGLLESVNRETGRSSLIVKKLILNNINICYNLINIQYVSPTKTMDNGKSVNFNPDGFAYQYWLSYKEKYVNSALDSDRLSEDEIFIKDYMSNIFFDGTNVVIDDEIVVVNIARRSNLPTVVFNYDCADGTPKKLSEFMKLMWEGRPNGDDTFKSRKIKLHWIPAKSSTGLRLSDYEVTIPTNFTDNGNGNPLTGNWEIDLQGTSTMRNRIKNYSLRINSENENGKILFSPNFDIENNRTFLPDVEWTIKADIADSAHANNTSIGKFVNDVCTPIDTNIPDINDDADAKGFIKNTLEGIPVLLYFMCTGKDDDGKTDITKIYYFGIYNFNLGRNSYYNLGYTGGFVSDEDGRSDFMRVFKNIKKEVSGKYASDGVFSFAVGDVLLSPHIAIGEIQDNYPQFDFHQYRDSMLFNPKGNNIASMFGTDSKITAKDVTEAKSALSRLVRSVAKAGKFCFQRIGRGDDFVTSRRFSVDDDNVYTYYDDCLNRYIEGKIPDTTYQMIYVDSADENGSYVRWEDDTECLNVSDYDLKKLITTFVDGESENKPILNFTSLSEYYTICMAFGMVDSILKNMNLKNFRSATEGPNFYCAFYDMDCALEEANDGEEKISYLAATDYWYSNIDENTNKVSRLLKKNDYWDNVNGGKGFDFTSSYLFAVAKYAKPIFESYVNVEDRHSENLLHYPQNFWAILRRPYVSDEDPGGGLQSADYFIEHYFKSGVTSTFEYLASLNYRVKYLYHGEVIDSSNNSTDKYLANAASFNGSRRIKVKNWLTKRLRFLDLMMNVNDLKVEIGNGLYYPGPGDNYINDLYQNNDITILHSAFDTNQDNTAVSTYNGVEVAINAPKHTPFIFRTGSSSADIYLLPGGIEKPNMITFSTTEAVATRFYGSGQFTSVDKIETMFTAYRSIISDNIEKITYGNTPVSGNVGDFIINAKSVREINLNIPNMGGKLLIDGKCQSLMKLNIANSKFNGVFNGFSNLQEVNISGVNSSEIYVSGSNYLTGDRFHISGSDAEHKTTLNVLNISGVKGNFVCENTNIGEIRISNSTKKDDPDFNPSMYSEFSISGDSRLTSLNLTGFRKVSITNCNNLESLTIDDALEELYIDLVKVKVGEVTSALVNIPFVENPSEEQKGLFDLTIYPNLKRVTLKNCDNLVWLKLPDNEIETDGINNNEKLKWIDTGRLPAFRDDKEYVYEGEKLPTYINGPKLILCSDNSFYNCPNYAMLRSDWDKGKEYINNENYIAYTNIKVSEKCTSLNNTFYVIGSSSSDDKFNMESAIRFIEYCVPDDVKRNIVSLSGCFRGRKNVKYTINEAAYERGWDADTYAKRHLHPMLEKYISVSDISEMYNNTGVNFISKNLLDLPFENNTPDKPLSWNSFIPLMAKMSVSDDALYNISYRLKSYSNINFTIYKYEDYSYRLVGENPDNMFKICDFFYPFDDGKKVIDEKTGAYTFNNVLPYNDINSLVSLNFGDQYIDFRGMFELFPNVSYLGTVFNGNLSKYNIDGLLRPCKNIETIIQSFCDNIVGSKQVIDLYNFFNWEENTTDVLNLFEGIDPMSNGFVINKTITYDNLVKILDKITEYNKLTRLTNIFSYCTITGYNNEEIKFSKKLTNINNISCLFENCTSDYIPFKDVDSSGNEKGIYKGGVLNIGKTFFKMLPNITIAQRTFANTYLSSPLTYNYFCKRSEGYVTKPVLMSKDKDDMATLYEYEYSTNMINLRECFSNVKFVNCKNWFDNTDGDNIDVGRNYIKTSNGKECNERGMMYYKYNDNSGSFEEYILDNDVIDDCSDNYTDYVSKNIISNKSGAPIEWYNHDLYQDFTYYGNIRDGIKPFDHINEEGVNTIQKTYCCLPPDFLYGCSASADVYGIFADSNIIGVIPRNLTKKIKSQSISNIFRNVNIMPNLEYYYDVNGSLNSILNEIEETVDIYDGSDSDSDNVDYCVVFRDEYGKLKKRKPVASDRNLGQFVYVPANFTTSGTLMNAFNFRYNLPRHWEIGRESDIAEVGHYKSTLDFNNAILDGKIDATKLPYHSQYYFITDKTLKWNNVYDAKSVFITNSQDIDFSNIYTMGEERKYCDENREVDITRKNTWVVDSRVSKPSNWTNNNIENFYIDLNLCGKKNEYNMIVDNGCPIPIKNRSVHLDNFISGILTVFLNGRIFDDAFVVNDLTSSYHKLSGGSSVIGYYGMGKNIILPKFNGSPLDSKFVFIPIGNDIVYYDFMLDNESISMSNYYEYFAKGKINREYLFETGYNKYTFK